MTPTDVKHQFPQLLHESSGMSESMIGTVIKATRAKGLGDEGILNTPMSMIQTLDGQPLG